MSKWNFVAMGQAGLTGWTREVARPVALAASFFRTSAVLSDSGKLLIHSMIGSHIRSAEPLMPSGAKWMPPGRLGPGDQGPGTVTPMLASSCSACGDSGCCRSPMISGSLRRSRLSKARAGTGHRWRDSA